MTADLAPIGAADLPAVAAFLHEHHNSRVPESAWANAVRVPWHVDAPNHGYVLRDAGSVVGAHLAYYADRAVAGRTERFCNLGAWCVLESRRAEGLRLLRALLAQRDYHFTDLSPSGNVVELNRRLRFASLDTTTALIPNLPWPPKPGIHVTDEPHVLQAELCDPALTIYADHERAAAARHLLLRAEDDACYVVYRHDRRQGVRAFATVLYASNGELFRRHAWRLGPYLLRRGAAATLVELRVAGGRPARSRLLRRSRPKMFKSKTLAAGHIDNLYSELTCLGW